MKKIKEHLSFRIGIAIVATEVIVLMGIGGYYIKRFNEEIDQGIISSIEIPGILMERGLLNYEAVSNEKTMERLIPGRLIEGCVIGTNNKIYYSLNPEYVGAVVSEIPKFDFLGEIIEDVEVSSAKRIFKAERCLASLTPLYIENKKHIGFLYLKIGTETLRREKASIAVFFILGSAFCIFMTSIVIMITFYLIISRNINKTLIVLEDVEEGDLDARIEAPIPRSEMGILQTGINSMISKLQEVIYKLKERVVDLKKAKDKIKSSLQEKEVLLREIHHRVGNNLQIISSLLRMQLKDVRDRNTRKIFQDSHDRVRSMALVHEKLYQSPDLSHVNLSDYIQSLVNHIFQSHVGHTDIIDLKMNIDEIFFTIDKAIPCGLVINELLSNSIEHAFLDGKRVEVKISLKVHGNMCLLIVADNGIGFPEDLDFKKTKSLGLQLVNILVEKQLEGEIELDRSGGTNFKIKFNI